MHVIWLINFIRRNMIVINLFLICVICVFIVDISGAVESLKSGIKWLLTKGKMSNSDYTLKPFDCSLCMTFWASIIYLLIIGAFTFKYIAIVCLFCTFCDTIKSTIYMVEDIVKKIIQLIYKYFIDK